MGTSPSCRPTIEIRGGPAVLTPPHPDGPQVRLDLAPLALHSGLLDLQVGEGLRLDRELVREAVALGLPPFVVRGAEL